MDRFIQQFAYHYQLSILSLLSVTKQEREAAHMICNDIALVYQQCIIPLSAVLTNYIQILSMNSNDKTHHHLMSQCIAFTERYQQICRVRLSFVILRQNVIQFVFQPNNTSIFVFEHHLFRRYQAKMTKKHEKMESIINAIPVGQRLCLTQFCYI